MRLKKDGRGQHIKNTPSVTGRRNHGVSWPRDLYVLMYIYFHLPGCIPATHGHHRRTLGASVPLFVLAMR